MKIQLIGTAGGDFPRVEDPQDNFAYLPRLRALGGRNLRRPAQAVIFPDILIDYYDGRQLVKFGIAPETIKHLFITHLHWDHCRPLEILKLAAGLPHLLQLYGSYHVVEALKFANTYDFNHGDGRFVSRKTRSDFEFHVVEPEQRVEVGDTAVTAVHANHSIDKTNHMIMSDLCLNYLFEREGKTFFYGLDSSYPFPHTVDFLRHFRLDGAVFDMTFGQWPIDPVKSGHHNLEMLTETIEELREAGIVHEETLLYASHIAMAEILPHDDLKDQVLEMGINLAYDGVVMDV